MANTYEAERSLGGTYACETGGEYTLPDYMPEVRRVLRVDCDAAPTGQYETQDKTEVGGEVRYTLLYLDGEGALSSASFDGTYECAIPGGEGSRMLALPTVENVSCRPGGPRRLTMRAGISFRPIGCVTEVFHEPEIAEDVGETQALRRALTVGRSNYLSSEETELTESVKAEPGSRLLSVSGRVLPREARAENGGVRIRADLWLNALCADGEGKPYSLKTKIPMEEYLPDENITPADTCLAWGVCPSLSATPTEGEGDCQMVFDARVRLYCLATHNEEISPMSDLYAVDCPTQVTRREMRGRYFPACMQGNFTVDGEIPLHEIGPDNGASVVDCRGNATVTGTSVNGNEISVEGDLKMQGIFGQEDADEAYVGGSFTVPYKVRFTAKEPLPEGTELHVSTTCVGWHTRCDGQKLSLDAELLVTCLASRPLSMQVVSEVTADTEHPFESRAGELVATYLSPEDSLWSIGRKYHLPLSAIADANNLPKEALETPDCPYCLDGMTRLMLEY